MINNETKDMMEEDMPEMSAIQDPTREKLTNIYAGMISSIGLTGREIAKLSGTRPQYISDIKRRQRPLSQDMFMRTLLGLYGDYKWLISGDLPMDTQRIITLYPYISNVNGNTMPLPVFQRPFMGPKLTADDWDGTFVCVTSPVKEQVKEMRNPYILHLPFNDKFGRLQKGDYLLVNQAKTADANYVLIKSGWGVKLARKCSGGFEDAENPDIRYPANSYVLGFITMLLMGKL